MAVAVPQAYPNLVGGRLAPAADGATFVRANPAQQGDAVSRFPQATAADLEAAVAAARDAQPAWGSASPLARAEVLERAAGRLAGRADAIAEELTREEGKPIAEARAEVQTGIATLRYLAGLARLPLGDTLPSARPGVFVYTVREPRGLVAVLTPWNFPFSIPCIKLGAALAAGNAVVFKPSPYTPLTAWRLVEALVEAGLPEGVLSFLTDSDGSIGRALVAHPSLDAVSFTGSTVTGRSIAETVARRLVPCQLELGGKNSMVVLDDADLDVAASAVATGAFSGTGQKCTSTGRVLATRKVARPLVERVLRLAADIRVGPSLDPETTMGPVVARERLDRILAIISEAQRGGARCLVGGRRLAGGRYDRGLFIGPTVLEDVKPGLAAADEEVFGPVLVVVEVSDEDDAIRVASQPNFGLVGGVCTRNPRRAFGLARAFRTGIVKINESTTGTEYQVPSAGRGESGFGDPELGPSALEFFSAMKAVYWSHGV